MLLLCLLPTVTRASIFDTYGFGSRGAAMGNALTAGALDYHAAYYNPASLLARKHTHVGLGVTIIAPALRVERDLRGGAAETLLPDVNVGVHVGVSTSIGGVFKDRLAFGFALFVPMVRLTRAQSTDAAVPQFYMFENLPDKLLILAGLAGEPVPWLRLGLGIQVLANLNGTADFSVDLLSHRVTRRRLSVDLAAGVAATAGIVALPMKGLSIGLSYRQAIDLHYELPLTALIEGVGTLGFKISGTSLYTPHQLSFGVAWRMPWVPLTLVADLTWAMWSRAPSPSPTTRVALDTSDLNGSTTPVFDTRAGPVPLAAQDIVIPRLGLEYQIGAFDIRAGYAWRPTPLPTPVYRTNYIDSDVHAVSLGAAWTFRDPLQVHKKPLTLGLVFQALILRERRVLKADPTDTTGSYTAKGAIFHVGVDIQHDF